MSNSSQRAASGHFPTTQWTQLIDVIQKEPDAAAWEALVEFCEQYRPAIYSFFRRRRCRHEQAEDYTQDFFMSRIHCRWDIREGFLFAARRDEQRRFRSFLCHVLWDFLKDKWKAENAQKAAGGKIHVSIDGLDFSDEEAEAKTLALVSLDLDRQIALEIIRKATDDSTRSKNLLAHFQGRVSQADAAKELGITENAFKQAFDRFKKSFSLNLRREVAKLVGPDLKDIEDELRYLMSIFSQSSA